MTRISNLLTQYDNNTPPRKTRAVGDMVALRKQIYDSVQSSAAAIPAVSNVKYQLSLTDVQYEDPDEYSLQEQKEAILKGRTLGRRLRGTWQLQEPGKAPITKRTTLARVPYLTQRGTFILDGTEYAMAHQYRLRPGIFARMRDTGELESHINVARGLGHRYRLDPDSGKFHLDIAQAKIPLLPILKALGATDRQIQDAWGEKIYAANLEKNPEQAVKKLLRKLYTDRQPDSADPHEAIRLAFEKMELDPAVTARTIGIPVDHMGSQAALAATKKLINIYRNEDEEDDRDAMAYQRLIGPEDVFKERMQRGIGAARRVLWKATATDSLDGVQARILEPLLRSGIIDSGLGNPVTEINPLELLDQQHRVTRMGEGGLSNLNVVPETSRQVHPSQLGFVDPVHTPEGVKIGIDTRLSVGVRKGDDGKIYTQFIDAVTGKRTWLTPQMVAGAVVTAPGELESGEPYVKAIVGGHEQYVPRKSVDFQLASAESMFGPLANMVPLKAGSFPQRITMGARYLAQALPMRRAESPLVRAYSPELGKSYEEHYGEWLGAKRSPASGVVVAVSPSEIKVKTSTGDIESIELYDNFPYARATFIYNMPLVHVGQQINKGTLVAKSNFTDDNGVAAMSVNARVAYLPTGETFEDAIVVSRSFADRTASEHAYQNTLDLDASTRANKNAFVSIYPSKYDKSVLEKFDNAGVIKKGTVVEPGEPLILAVKERTTGTKIGRRKRSWADASVLWEHENAGIVTDTHHGPKGINVVVKSENPTQDGDKLAILYGNKGVVIVKPDEEMPTDAEGNTIEVLLNPTGIPSRGNISQLAVAGLGKIAKKTGQPYNLAEFSIPDLRQFVLSEFKRNQVSEKEDLLDPKTGQKIPEVVTGVLPILKLYHTAESKLEDRGESGAYTSEDIPTKGEGGSPKRIGILDLHALLSHGAYKTIADASNIRGQRRDDLWRQYMAGYPIPNPVVPTVWKRFVAQLEAAGIRPIRTAHRTQLLALTNQDVEELGGDRILSNADTIKFTHGELKPVAGGLFDPHKTEGLAGTRWSRIKLVEPMPNPVMVEPIRRLLDLTNTEFVDVLIGKQTLGEAAPGSKRIMTGPAAIKHALENINIDKEIANAKNEIASGRTSYRDQAIRKLQYLTAAKNTKQHPKDWMWDSVPVLPPTFRPVSIMGRTGTVLSADANPLYKAVFDANANLKALRSKVDDVSEERKAVWDAMTALAGLTDPAHPKLKEQRVKGFLAEIIGTSPKSGTVQRKLLGIAAQLVGRGVVTPNPQLDMDQLGLPEETAWTLFRPFVVRRLVRRGMPMLDALKAVEDRNDRAKQMLLQEMDERPIIMNRAPVLHKYGIMAFRPVLTSKKTLQVPPIIVGPFGMDFDGDAVQIHVPLSPDAVKEAYEKMLPSSNLLMAADMKSPAYTPAQEFLWGLWAASKKKSETTTKVFASAEDVLRAFRRGDLRVGQRVKIAK